MNRKVENKKVYSTEEIRWGIGIHSKIFSTVKVMLYMMKHKWINNFSVIMVNSKMDDFGKFLKANKRTSDILVEIHKSKNIYILVCEETEVDGSYYFINRLSKEADNTKHPEGYGHTINALALSVESDKYETEDIVFKLIDVFHKFKSNEAKSNIIYKTLV